MRSLFTKISHYYIFAAVFMLGLILFLPDSGYDKYFWVTWAQYIKEHGLTDAYNNPEINYHPIILFIIKGFTLFVSNPDYTNINWLKVPTALFDWGIIFVALKLIQKHKVNLQWGLLLAFNPAFWYNTIIWGQFDSIWIFFTLAAFYVALNNKWFWSIVLFALALNTKLFALLFLPFLFPLWIKDKTSQMQLLRPLPVLLVLQVLFILPFLFTTNYSLYDIISRSTEYYNSVSRNAYNIWYYIFSDPVNTSDESILAWTWIFLFAALTFLFILRITQKINIWQALVLFSITYFLFLTRMHERYAYAALVFSFIAFFSSPFLKGVDSAQQKTGDFRGVRMNLIAFLLISIAYLLNLEAVMQTLNKSLGMGINYHTLIFNPQLIAGLYVISLVLLVISTFTAQKHSQETA